MRVPIMGAIAVGYMVALVDNIKEAAQNEDCSALCWVIASFEERKEKHERFVMPISCIEWLTCFAA